MPSAYALQDGQKFKSWTGKCETMNGQQFCGIKQTVFDKQKKPIIDIFIRKMQGQSEPVVFIKVPLRVFLPAGLGLAVDRQEIAQVPYLTCDQAGCNALVGLDSNMVKKIKKGSQLQIGMMVPTGTENKEIVLSASLSGVTKALNAL